MTNFNMQNIILWIKRDGNRGYKFRYRDNFKLIQSYLKLQIENSLNLGWNKDDLVVITNFPFEYMGVKAHIATDICSWSAFANKLVVINEMIQKGIVHDNFWLHDNDAYQLVPFDFPEECKDVGYAKHAVGRQKPQGGSAFYRKSAFDIVDVVANGIKLFKATKEESFFPYFYQKGGHKATKRLEHKFNNAKQANPDEKMLLMSQQVEFAKRHFAMYEDRFSWLNYTYNLSQQRMFTRKYPRTDKPVKVVHFHPEHPSTMNCYYYGNNSNNVKIVTDDLEELFIKHGFILSNNRR